MRAYERSAPTEVLTPCSRQGDTPDAAAGSGDGPSLARRPTEMPIRASLPRNVPHSGVAPGCPPGSPPRADSSAKAAANSEKRGLEHANRLGKLRGVQLHSATDSREILPPCGGWSCPSKGLHCGTASARFS